MSWIFLIAAGLFEMSGVLMINVYQYHKNVSSLLGLVASFLLSFICLSVAMDSLPMGTAYAVWTGLGAAGGAILGMIFYNESKDWRRILCISIIIAAVAGIKLSE
ncbi:QacE family quaternary ammonium compound efflux SMR transporter [Halobacillus andaensis]|uniref:QacE family quaternary ammonium compound efflux SMR transporter n=1 Tax=Halobacillus andaensis TaxID=1176239 RepID=A0A917B904_HALAA|nr:multidrug efflux SMR transporter [Halobacillus andaensis]MBP2005535.1 paired small multidrug resistance pump [Halobacillus andaensis]GGF32242.1 QacE family quaternary ammonium compound efflux SMR transporter [Halobacillus andaensis]